MTTLSELNGYGEELERRLMLRTSPIAIKLLQKEEDIPAGAIRPKRDRGYHLGLCQAFAMSRREKATVAMLKEDNWCYIPVVAFGLAQPPDLYLQGGGAFPAHIADLQAAKKWVANYPRLEYGKYIGVVSAPLKTASFEPDLVAMYCNSGQLRALLTGIKYREGYLVTSTLEPSGACVLCTVPVIKSGDCQVTVPCGGDKRNALAQDDELIFSLPTGSLDNLMMGIRHIDETSVGYTLAPIMRPDYPLFKLYVKMGKLVGLDVHD